MRVLREVAAQGSFSAAAEALAYTQSAVSQQIAALEREAGTRLVERARRARRARGRLRLVAFPSVAASLMPQAIARFRAAHPAVELTLGPAEPDEGMAMVKAGEADIALSIELPEVSETAIEGLTRTVLMDDPVYALLPADHPLAGRRRLKLADLAGESWIVGSSAGSCPDARIHLRACTLAGFDPLVAFQSDDYFAIQGFVAAGVGVALIAELACVSVRDVVVVRSLGATAPARRIVAVTASEAWESPAREAMLGLLVDVGRVWGAERRQLRVAG